MMELPALVVITGLNGYFLLLPPSPRVMMGLALLWLAAIRVPVVVQLAAIAVTFNRRCSPPSFLATKYPHPELPPVQLDCLCLGE